MQNIKSTTTTVMPSGTSQQYTIQQMNETLSYCQRTKFRQIIIDGQKCMKQKKILKLNNYDTN